MKTLRQNLFLSTLSALAAVVLSSCGPQTFAPNQTALSSSAGGMNLPPKVDIVLGISMNGTFQNIYPGVQQELPRFISKLQASNWDYRFVSIPLSEYYDMSNYSINNSVSVSNYDTNYSAPQWLPSLPGLQHNDPNAVGIISSLFSSVFKIPVLDTSHNDAHETGLLSELTFLNRSDIRSNFIRPDALLAVITISNGDDRSGGYWPSNNANWVSQTPVSTYAATISAIKPAGQLKVYTLAAAPTVSCRNYNAWSALRYIDYTNTIGGQFYDICSNGVELAFDKVADSLNTIVYSYIKNYLSVATEPNPSTIQVTRNGVPIPNDPTNGWTYLGPVQTAVAANGGAPIYSINSPVKLDQITTGYVIKLNGTAQLHGSETANVTYQNAGTVITH